jgi:rubrerythrin
MNALLLTVVMLLMAKTLAGIYLGGAYTCPSCGTRREDEHAEECPWSR